MRVPLKGYYKCNMRLPLKGFVMRSTGFPKGPSNGIVYTFGARIPTTMALGPFGSSGSTGRHPTKLSRQLTHRPQSSSFLGLPHRTKRILNMNPKKELLWGLWVLTGSRVSFWTFRDRVPRGRFQFLFAGVRDFRSFSLCTVHLLLPETLISKIYFPNSQKPKQTLHRNLDPSFEDPATSSLTP